MGKALRRTKRKPASKKSKKRAPKRKAAPKPQPDRLTRREIAQKHGVILNTVTKWEQAGMPVAEPGRKGKPSLYDPAAVEKWLKEREQAAREGGAIDLAREKARRERAQAVMAEQLVATRAGDLVSRKDAEKALADEILRIRTKLLAWERTLPERIGRAYELRKVRGVGNEIRKAVEELLLDLSKTDDLDAIEKERAELAGKSAKKKRTAKKTRGVRT